MLWKRVLINFQNSKRWKDITIFFQRYGTSDEIWTYAGTGEVLTKNFENLFRIILFYIQAVVQDAGSLDIEIDGHNWQLLTVHS